MPGAAPPGTVVLGIRDGSEVPTDVTAMGGLGLTGPGAPAAARAVLAALLARAVPGQPAGPAEVIMPAADAALLLPGWDTTQHLPGLTVTPALPQALDRAEALLLRRARTTGTTEIGDDPPPATPRQARPVAVLIATPPRDGQRLAAVLDTGRRAALAGILLGPWPPGTTCHVAADGVITSADPALDGTQMFHLDADATTDVLRLLQQACATPGTGEDHPARVPAGPPPAQGRGAGNPAPQPAAAAPAPPGPQNEISGDPGTPAAPASACSRPRQPPGAAPSGTRAAA